MKKIFLLGIFFGVFSLTNVVQAATYYVDNAGNDACNGTAQTIGASGTCAWKTIAKVNAATFAPGDSILFKRGGLWREQLLPHNSGTSGNVITYGAYGTGDKPKIYASDVLSNWTVHSGNIWKANHTGTVGPIWFISSGNIKWGDPKTSIAGCVNEFDWYFTGDVVYVYSPTDPDTRYSSVEGGFRTGGIRKNNKNYITADNLEIAFSSTSGIELSNPGYSGWTVQNCDVHHVGVINSSSAHCIVSRDDDSVFQNNRLYHCGTHGIYIVGDANPVSNVTIRDNEIWDCPHTGIDIMSYVSGTVVENVKIYRNKVYSTNDYPGAAGVYMVGIQTLGQSGGISRDIIIAYNSVYSLYGLSYLIGSGSQNVKLINNTGYKSAGSFDGMAVLFDADDPVLNVTLKNNLMMEVGSNNFNINNTSTIASADYNISYHSDTVSGRLARVGATTYYYNTFNNYKSATGFDTHGFWQDPQFVDPLTRDFRLRSSSPGAGTGIWVAGVHDLVGTDMNGATLTSGDISIGAYSYESGADLTPPAVPSGLSVN